MEKKHEFYLSDAKVSFIYINRRERYILFWVHSKSISVDRWTTVLVYILRFILLPIDHSNIPFTNYDPLKFSPKTVQNSVLIDQFKDTN